MTSQGGKHISTEQEKEEENFYDCQEIIEIPDGSGGETGKQEKAASLEDLKSTTHKLTDVRVSTQGEERVNGLQEHLQDEDEPVNKLQDEDEPVNKLQDEDQPVNKLQDEDQPVNKLQDEDEPVNKLQDEDQPVNKLQDEDEPVNKLQQDDQDNALLDDLDTELKENSKEVEFDDDYLREVEKELTEEEKESRRQQSLTLKEKGNSHFKDGKWLEAEQSYKEALVLCPVCFSKERAVLFSNRAAARLHLDLKDQAIADCSRAIELNPDYVRALLRRAELYEQTEKLDEALEDYKKVLDCDPNQASAREACMRLPQQINERNEKLKEEMLSKLKDLGNLVLRPFGLSTNNFQVKQDAGTGSYSINFVQNPNTKR